MSSKWDVVPLGQLYEFTSGLSKPRSEFGTGYPFLSFKDVFYNFFVPSTLTELVNSTEQERLSRSIKRGDVFLTRTSETMEELGMSSVALRDIPDATFNGFTKRLRPKLETEIVPEYAGYYFRSPMFRQAMSAMSSLSTRASLNNEMLARLAITIPPMEVQNAIGCILKSLDDKIELNRQMNETLEAMARAMFKSWFVDFEPARAKAEGRDTGLPKEISDLFPDSFEDSELGEVPKGWRVRSFTDTVEVIGGGTPKTSVDEYWNGDIPWFSVVDAPSDTDVFVVGTQKNITSAGLENSSTRLLAEGTTIISARGTVGKVALVGVPMTMNQSCYGLRGIDTGAYFTYYATRNLVTTLKQHSHGSVFDTITRDTLTSMTAIAPSSHASKAFESIVEPMMQRIKSNTIESRALATQRDTLLPKLLTGELKCSNTIGG